MKLHGPRLKIFISILIIAGIFFSYELGHGDSITLAQSFCAYSESMLYKAEILPNNNRLSKKTPTAVIYRKTNKEYSEQSRVSLVNKASPAMVFISDNGTIVTIDDWVPRGHEHCVVVYSKEGKLLRDYALEDILNKDEIAADVKQTVSNRWWLRGPDRDLTPEEVKQFQEEKKKMAWWARIILGSARHTSSDPPKLSFSQDGMIFTIETGWGKVLKFDLVTGNLLTQAKR